jgi:hypothetical protein
LGEQAINSYRDLRVWQESMALAESCYLRIAQGSLKEVETHLLLAQRVGLLADTDISGSMAQCESIGKMLRPLIRSLQKKAIEP